VIKKILIGSDPLMTQEREQSSNNRWLLDLLRRPIARATGLTPELMRSEFGIEGVLDREAFFGRSGISLDRNATQFWFDDQLITGEAKKYLARFFRPDTLVVGYELSAQTRRLLDDLGVPYIDIWLHPVRFMDDVMFAFNSNDLEVRGRMFQFDVPEDQMFLHADRVKIQTYKGWRRVEADIEENSALFVGQMLNDKSVCRDGHMLNILDFPDRVEEVAETHARLYYARHPYLKHGDEAIMRYIRRHPKIELTTIPAYRMLASNRLTKVFGVSSSVITEARYFEKDAEHLFRPIFGYGVSADPESYATICQDFVSPHFWSTVLRPLIKTNECPVVTFTNGKDKIRDALGFYWSYPDIDKVEHIRREQSDARKRTSRGNQNKKSARSPLRTQSIQGFYQASQQLAEIEKKMAGVDVVSFDVFDTLIERIVDQPNDIFPMMAEKVRLISGGKIDDFTTARQQARQLASAAAVGEEVLLRDRYQALASSYELGADVADKMLELELNIERQVCKPRYAGKRLFERAQQQGKRVILVSDIFFEREFVEELLASAGIANWDHLYLSSEEGVLKHSGRLFDVVLAREGITPENILHIGDNPTSDIKRAKEKGIRTAYLTDKRVIADRVSNSLRAFEGISDPGSRSLVRGLASRELTSTGLLDTPGATNANPETLGYGVAGPFFWGFAKWIYRRAVEEGLTDVYFLARDGEIAKRCYDRVTRDDPSAPRSHYILASRRAVNVPRMKTSLDVLRALDTPFATCSLATLLLNRFGIAPGTFSISAFNDAGFYSEEDVVHHSTDKVKVEGLLQQETVWKKILSNAKSEKAALLEAYAEEGLTPSSNNVGFVDIGHSGSLQSAICDMLSLKGTTGLYFATNEDIDLKIREEHQAFGYVADRIPHKDNDHPYQEHILMFELLFQNDQGSFLCYEGGGGSLVPKYLDASSERPRIDFIRKVHQGAERFCEDISEAQRLLDLNLQLDGAEAILGYKALLSAPYPIDAEMFQGIGFENKYNSRDIQWIVPNSPAKARSAVWREAARVLFPGKREEVSIESSTTLGVRMLSLCITNKRKRAKLTRDPDAFFADSKQPLIKALGKII